VKTPLGQRHYFIENPDQPVDERELALTLFNRDFHFTTAAGLFSYERIDDASRLLLEVMHLTHPHLTGSLLDLGCGYGFLGIVLALTRDIRLTMADTNRVACGYAERNAKRNGVKAEVIHSDGFENITGLFNHIVLNPPIHAGKEVMYRLYEGSAAQLCPGGALYIVIQKKHGAETAFAFLNQIFPTVHTLHKRKGYYIYRCAVRT
jgi:16S rRNA (guanine1207-N2)-methyltransferase